MKLEERNTLLAALKEGKDVKLTGIRNASAKARILQQELESEKVKETFSEEEILAYFGKLGYSI